MAALLRGEVIGIIFLVLAVFTLLCLPTARRGSVTAWWVNALKLLFGVGVWISPLVFGLIGAWLVWRHMARDVEVRLRRPIGVTLLFLVFLAAAHLIANPADPEALAKDRGGGGLLGWILSQSLVSALSVAGAALILFAILVVGSILVWGVSLEEFGQAVQRAVARLRERKELTPSPPPLPSGQIPAWRRWWQKIWPPRGAPAEAAVPPTTPETRPVMTTEPSEGAPRTIEPRLFPRVIGGDQEWRLPPIEEILEEFSEQEISREDLRRKARIIEETLASFGVPVKVVEANQGPAVTQFGLKPGTVPHRTNDGRIRETRVKVSQIARLSNDLALALAASPIRIETPVPGRDIVGVEVPNTQLSLVSLGGVMLSETFQTFEGRLKIGLGRDVSGAPAVADLALMPHLLIAGATGSGKSVCINSIVTCLLCTHTPRTLRFLMIDPKMVELTIFNGIPHLITPVVVELERVVSVLRWATREMDRRYRLFNKAGARHLDAYNEMLASRGEAILPYIVIVIDELADLMMVAADEVERSVCRIAQMARATGLHLIIATQRPSVDVVTGLIKANFPARIAFAVTSQVDSRVILDQPGAERLLGRGDMLLMTPDSSKLVRLQGCFVSDRELKRLVRFWKGVRGPEPSAEEMAQPPFRPQDMIQQPLWEEMIEREREASSKDDLYDQAVQVVREANRASISLLQRRLRIGYSRAARLMDALEEGGIIGAGQPGGRGREVLPPAEGKKRP
ncbi:MAG: DNA translocase FtsK 4TM domain-containing protein [Anaerolineae bacterium]|nr:DNA translocase FtsK 4TM domain-containing protein [Anaerolineae bacterium]